MQAGRCREDKTDAAECERRWMPCFCCKMAGPAAMRSREKAGGQEARGEQRCKRRDGWKEGASGEPFKQGVFGQDRREAFFARQEMEQRENAGKFGCAFWTVLLPPLRPERRQEEHTR